MHKTTHTLDSWESVQRFCEQRVVENAMLDYKQSLPSDLNKTVAAMANTLGGVILIGVAEDGMARPQVPATGMELKRGLVEQVVSKCVDNITPPIFPEVVECENQGKDKIFLVVRVPQSPQAPHAISRNTMVYIRTGRQNDPEELASLERIEWIAEQRKKSEELREWLIVRAAARFDLLRRGGVPGITRSDDADNDRCLLTLALSPVYPDTVPLVRPPDLEMVRRQIVVRDPMGTSNYEFPVKGEAAVRSVEDGMIIHAGECQKFCV